jgi:hypothetical protein
VDEGMDCWIVANHEGMLKGESEKFQNVHFNILLEPRIFGQS